MVSDPGRGSTFSIHVPAWDQAPRAVAAADRFVADGPAPPGGLAAGPERRE